MRTRFLIILLMTALLTATIPVLADEELLWTNFNTAGSTIRDRITDTMKSAEMMQIRDGSSSIRHLSESKLLYKEILT